MSGYIGTQPVPQATQTRDAFTATSGQTSFATSGYTPNFLDVFLNGVKMAAADYTASNGSDVVLATGAATGDILEVVAYTTFDTANVTGAANFTVTGSFTSQGIDDNANATAITIDSSENVGIGISNPSDYYTNFNDLVLGNTSTHSGMTVVSGASNDGTIAFADGTSGDAEYKGYIQYNHTNNDLGIGVNGTEKMRIDSSGHAIIPAGVTLGTATGVYAAANTLDDYEEGTWTPTQSTFDTWSSPTFSATYTKVGNLVTVFLQQTGGTIGWSAGDTMGGLPFAPVKVGCGYAMDTNVADDNGPLLPWTSSVIYFLAANASEGGLVFTLSYTV